MSTVSSAQRPFFLAVSSSDTPKGPGKASGNRVKTVAVKGVARALSLMAGGFRGLWRGGQGLLLFVSSQPRAWAGHPGSAIHTGFSPAKRSRGAGQILQRCNPPSIRFADTSPVNGEVTISQQLGGSIAGELGTIRRPADRDIQGVFTTPATKNEVVFKTGR